MDYTWGFPPTDPNLLLPSMDTLASEMLFQIGLELLRPHLLRLPHLKRLNAGEVTTAGW